MMKNRMKIVLVSISVALLAGVSSVQAHPHLLKANPAEGSAVASAPSAVVLTFSEAARLTAAWIKKGAEAQQKLAPLPEKPAAEVTLAIPKLTPGTYVVSWRAVSDDGHVMPGQLHFTISETGAAKD